MITEAKAYLASRNIVRREPLYSAHRLARHLGDLPASDITTEHLDQLRDKLRATKMSHRTIESTIADLITVISATIGFAPQRGKRLSIAKPRPHPVTTDSIDLIWPHCSPMLRSWISLTYWTGLRLSDGLRWMLYHKSTQIPEIVCVIASKTQTEHRFPVPGWLRQILVGGRYRFRTVSDFARRSIRCEIQSACVKAGVSVVSPKHFRQRSITEWTRANATAGAIVHGSGLGVMVHYLDPLSVLESAAPRVRLPRCFGACVGDRTETTLLTHFRRLDPAAQTLIAGTAERLATG